MNFKKKLVCLDGFPNLRVFKLCCSFYSSLEKQPETHHKKSSMNMSVTQCPARYALLSGQWLKNGVSCSAHVHAFKSLSKSHMKWMRIGESSTNGEVIILKGSTKNRCNKKLHTNDCWNGFQSTIESVWTIQKDVRNRSQANQKTSAHFIRFMKKISKIGEVGAVEKNDTTNLATILMTIFDIGREHQTFFWRQW